MENSENNLNAYIKKVIEIQQQQESQALSNEQLSQIAMNMGLSESDLRKAQEAYLQRGKGYLQFNNAEDAIREFQQAVILQPHNENALFGLAKAYQQLWQKTGKKSFRDQAEDFAQKCLEINPNHQESFRLISALKPANYSNSNNRPNQAVNPLRYVILFIAIILFLSGFIMVFLLSKPSTDNLREQLIKEAVEEVKSIQPEKAIPSNSNINSFYAPIGKKGAVVWLVTYTQKSTSKGFSRDYTLQINDFESGKNLQTLTLAKDIDFMERVGSNFKQYGDKMYSFDEKTAQIEARDIYTGKVVENNETLSQSFPELSKGIGSVKQTAGWFEIITKDGQKYWYAPTINFLASDAQKDAATRNRSDQTKVYDVFFTDDTANRKVYIVSRQVSPFNLNYDNYSHSQESKEANILARLERTQRFGNQLVGKITDRTFTNAKLLYSAQDYILIWHESEVSPNAKPLLTCISPQGKILWFSENPNSLLIKELRNLHPNSLNPTRFENQLCMAWTYVKVGNKTFPFALNIDLKTGKIIETSPTYAGN
jgi:hypothetical protein